MEICVWTMSFGFTAAFWTIYSWFSLWIYIADCKFHMKLIAPPFLSPLNEWQLRGDSSSPSSGFVSLSRRARLKRLDILIRSTVTLTRNCLHPLEKWMYRRWTDIVWIEYWSNHRFCWMLLQDVVSRCCFKMLLQDVVANRNLWGVLAVLIWLLPAGRLSGNVNALVCPVWLDQFRLGVLK